MTELETIYQNFVVLIGACFLAGFIGSFAEFLSHNDESGQSAYETKVQKLQDYMKYRNLPQQLQEEILFFHHHKWNNSHLLDEREVLSILPIPLQKQLSYEILQPVIKKFPVLTEIETRVQKRISHAFSRHVCPPHATIYEAGDIGWDVYFISSGLVKIDLPSNIDILDEEGRANHAYVKEKATSVGLLYRAGNHFGESCLRSQSGVREETVTAKTTATLFLISKANLQLIFDSMSPEEKAKIINNLLSRNGNVWHSFRDINELIDEQNQNKQSRSYIRNKSENVSIVKAQKNRRSTNSNRRRTQRRRSTRLRSFSAEASAQAMHNRTTNSLITLGESDGINFQNSCIEAALNISKRSDIVTLPTFAEGDDSEMSTSNYLYENTETSTSYTLYENTDDGQYPSSTSGL